MDDFEKKQFQNNIRITSCQDNYIIILSDSQEQYC